MAGIERMGTSWPGVTRHGIPGRTFNTVFYVDPLLDFSAVDAPPPTRPNEWGGPETVRQDCV